MFQSLSLQKKLLGLSVVTATILGAVAFVGYRSLSNVDALYSGIVEEQYPKIDTLKEMEFQQMGAVLAVMGMASTEHGSKEYQGARDRFVKARDFAPELVKRYEGFAKIPGEQESWAKMKAPLLETFRLLEEVFAIAEKNGPNAEREAEDRVNGPIGSVRAEFRKQNDAHQDFLTDYIKANSDQASVTADVAYWTVGVGAAIGIFVALLVGFLTARGLSRALSAIANRLVQGSREVSSATASIASAGSQLSASSTEQAAALQETVASLEEVSAMVNKSAENARKSLETSARSRDAADKGKGAVDDVIGSIEQINRANAEIMGQVEQSNREIGDIVKVIGEISEKTKVINDIVFQTKLLSFNASVEAARAGEHGKGFAVVAEEVGNLAQMSGNAAKEISSMLEESMRKVEGIAEGTKSKVEKLVVMGREKVEAGSVTAKRCAEVLDEIVRNVGEVNQMIDEISTACREQAQGVQEINKAMGQLDQVTQQNSTAAQQSANAADQLRVQTGDLDDVVSTLRRTVEGGHGGETGTPSAEPRSPAPRPVAKSSEKANNVVALPKPKAKRPTAAAPARAKKVVGGDVVPEADDPRFEDV